MKISFHTGTTIVYKWGFYGKWKFYSFICPRAIIHLENYLCVNIISDPVLYEVSGHATLWIVLISLTDLCQSVPNSNLQHPYKILCKFSLEVSVCKVQSATTT